MKIFGREPALVVGVIGAALTALASVNLPFLNAGQAAALTAVVAALVIAWTTRPAAPALFTGAFAALVALVAEYGLELSDEMVGSVTALIVAICALLGIRPQVSPQPTALTRG